LLDRFAPLLATRSLGKLSPEKLKELGFPETKKRLIVQEHGTPHPFLVSTAASVGAPYLRREDGEVFVLGGTAVSDLESAVESGVPGGRLLERQLHAFKLEPDDTVRIEAGKKTRELVVTAGDVPQTVKLAPKDSPGSPDGFAKNWHDKLWRMAPQELLGKGETPPTGPPAVELRIVYGREKRELGFLEVGRSGRDIYARSEQTLGWVKLPPTGEESLLEGEKAASG
jgi:hypothetical protein